VTNLSIGGNAATASVAPAGTLTGTTLNSSVVTSSLTSVGTLTGLAVTSANTTQVTTASALVLNANSLTTGTGLYATSSSLTWGSLVDIQVSGTAAAAGQTAINIQTDGATATNAITTFGAQIRNTHTNATSGTNIGLLVSASGATTANHGLIVASGNVGIGTTPTYLVDILSPTLTDFGTKWAVRARGPSSCTTNASNYMLAFDMDLSNMSISSGVTDSGYRMGVRGDAYAGVVGFAGTLSTQYGVLGRAGIGTATSGAVVTNAEGLHGEVLNSVAGTTITNGYGLRVVNTGTTGAMTHRWGVHVDTASGGKNYFSHSVGVGMTPVRTLDVTGTFGATGISTFGAPITIKGYTVATLPAGVVGYVAYVTDALAPAYGVAVAGGGAVVTPVFYNGAAWTCR
jgi:hypothetical protein